MENGEDDVETIGAAVQRPQVLVQEYLRGRALQILPQHVGRVRHQQIEHLLLTPQVRILFHPQMEKFYPVQNSETDVG